MSKLQTDIYISTLNSEYGGVSKYVRYLLPPKILFREVVDKFGTNSENLGFISSSIVYEESNGFIVMAKSPRIGPNSKEIRFEHHSFRQHIGKRFVIRNIES